MIYTKTGFIRKNKCSTTSGQLLISFSAILSKLLLLLQCFLSHQLMYNVASYLTQLTPCEIAPDECCYTVVPSGGVMFNFKSGSSLENWSQKQIAGGWYLFFLFISGFSLCILFLVSALRDSCSFQMDTFFF